MEREILLNIIKMKSSTEQPFEMNVDGSSMLPVILPTDSVLVLKSKEYAIGDILLFLYEDHHILIHRLLKIINGNYCCKGDNSFRLETVKYSDILGGIIAIKRQGILIDLPSIPQKYLNMSYLIYREFIKSRFNVEQTKNTPIYNTYKEEYLKGGNNI